MPQINLMLNNIKIKIQFKVPTEKLVYLTRIQYMSHNVPEDGIFGEHEIDYVLIYRGEVDTKINENEVRDIRYIKQESLKELLGENFKIFNYKSKQVQLHQYNFFTLQKLKIPLSHPGLDSYAKIFSSHGGTILILLKNSKMQQTFTDFLNNFS